MAQPLYIAELIIYIILLQPAFYVLWKHGKHGILGWLYLQLFCVIRVVGSALNIHDETAHTGGNAALILSNVGLSPLLLAAAGVLHEARTYRSPALNRKIQWLLVMQYHVLVSGSLALIVVAVVFLEGGHTTPTTSTLLKAGAAVVVLCWVLLCIWTFVSRGASRAEVYGPAYEAGTALLQGVTIALFPIGLRLIYAVTTLVLEVDKSASTFPTSLAAKVVMSVVPEMLVVIVLVLVGLRTRNVKQMYGQAATKTGPERAGGDA